MKKILVFSIVFILLIGIVSSSALSTLWKQGVSAANPQAARVISMADQIMEIKTIAQCATGVVASACMQSIAEQKAMGQVYGEAIKAAGPEVQKIISTYQQLDLYREAGAELVDLKIDEEGKIESGTIKPSEKDIKIGENFGLNKEEIVVKNSEVRFFNEKERENNLGVAGITFDKKGASAKIGVNDFSGIQSQEETGKLVYIELDKDGNIVKARFMTGEKGRVFNFGGVEFETPPNSNVGYDAEFGELWLSKGSEVKEFSDFEEGKGIKIIGKDIKITNEILLKDGTIKITKKGYFLKKYSEVKYKQISLNSYDLNEVLIANSNEDMSDYFGNWIRQTNNKLELKSCSDLNCNFNAQILENNEILNTDYNDKLIFKIGGGDGLIIKKGSNGKTQKVLHKSSDGGYTHVTNDGLTLNFDRNDIKVIPQKSLTLEDLKSGKFQSVTFEMESDSSKVNNKLIIDSFSKLSMISKNLEKRVLFQKQGLPKSLLNMKQEEINKLISDVEKVSGEGNSYGSEYVLPTALKAGFNPDQIVKIISDTMGGASSTTRPGWVELERLHNVLSVTSKAGFNPVQTKKLIDKAMQTSGKDSKEKLENLRFMLEETLKFGFKPDYITNSIDKLIQIPREDLFVFSNVFKSASKAGFNPVQTKKLIDKAMQTSGKDSSETLSIVSSVLSIGLNPEETIEFINDISKKEEINSELALSNLIYSKIESDRTLRSQLIQTPDRIENIRLSLNHLSKSKTQGDKFLFESMGNELRNVERFTNNDGSLNYDKTEELLDSIVEWRYIHVHEDVKGIYETNAMFAANEIAKKVSENFNECKNDIYCEDIIFTLERMGISFDVQDNNLQKIKGSIQNNGLVGGGKYIVRKAATKTSKVFYELFGEEDKTEIREEMIFKRGPATIESKEIKVTKKGFITSDIVNHQGENVAIAVIGNPLEDAKVFMDVKPGEGVSEKELIKKIGRKKIVTDFPVAYTTGNLKPVGFAARQGKTVNWLLSEDKDALVVVRNNKLTILDSRNLKLSEISKISPNQDKLLDIRNDAKDYYTFIDELKKQKATVVSSTLLAKDSKIEKLSISGNDRRRLLLTFNDGRFGMIDFKERITLKQATQMALKIPGVKDVVNADTGMYDRTSIYDDGGKQHVIGHADKSGSNNRIAFGL
jgi:hypothetical protein